MVKLKDLQELTIQVKKKLAACTCSSNNMGTLASHDNGLEQSRVRSSFAIIFSANPFLLVLIRTGIKLNENSSSCHHKREVSFLGHVLQCISHNKCCCHIAAFSPSGQWQTSNIIKMIIGMK
jgi:hypothetical protein